MKNKTTIPIQMATFNKPTASFCKNDNLLQINKSATLLRHQRERENE